MAAYTEVTGTAETMVANTRYIANNSSLITFTLPITSAFGSYLIIIGKGAGGWKIEQPNGSIIHYGNVDTTTGNGGSISSTNMYDCVELVCTAANLEWTVINRQGNLTPV